MVPAAAVRPWHAPDDRTPRYGSNGRRPLVGCRGGPVRLLGDDDFVGSEGFAPGPAIDARRRRGRGPAIHDDAEVGASPERHRQEIEQLGVAARHDDPVACHPERDISADGGARFSA